MRVKTFYHGTPIQNLDSILSEGLKPNKEKGKTIKGVWFAPKVIGWYAAKHTMKKLVTDKKVRSFEIAILRIELPRDIAESILSSQGADTGCKNKDNDYRRIYSTNNSQFIIPPKYIKGVQFMRLSKEHDIVDGVIVE